MRPTLLLKGLLDAIGPDAKETTNSNWCQDEGETTPAVSWCPVCDVSLCSNCIKAHRRITSTKHHDVSNMTEEVKEKVRGRTKVKCQEHKEEFVKFFCRDCRRTLCQSCCILYPRKCESVVSLKSMLPNMRITLETRKDTLMNKSRVEEEQVESFETRYRELEANKSSIQSQIRSTTQKVIDIVKKKDRELLDTLTEVTDKQIDQLKADMKTRDMACYIYNQQVELIDQALKSQSEMEFYGVYQASESEAAESVGEVKKRRPKTRIDFSQDVDKLERVLSELGEIQVLDVFDLDTVSSPVLSHTVDCRTKVDQDKPQLFDIVSIAVKGFDTIIVNDYNNNCIKSFFKRKIQQNHSRLSMNSQPFCITKLNNMYDLYQSSESETAESVGGVKKRGTRTRIEFSQDVDRLDKELSEMSLGKIQVLDVFDLDTVSSTVLSHTVDCRTREDQEQPIALDIVKMEVKGSDTIIVNDLNNKCIKSFFKRNNKQHHSRVSMKSEPGNIIQLDDKIAVTLPLSKEIAVVSVTPDLTLDSTITTQKQYRCLTALTPITLEAGSVSPPCVDIIDESGNVMRSICPIHDGWKITQTPCFLSTTRQGNILMSNRGTKSVVCVTPQGEMLFNYSPTGDRALGYPAGITSTSKGLLLVVDCEGDMVIVLSETGDFIRDLLTSENGICDTGGIDWDERERVFVTHHGEDESVFVQVYMYHPNCGSARS